MDETTIHQILERLNSSLADLSADLTYAKLSILGAAAEDRVHPLLESVDRGAHDVMALTGELARLLREG